MESDKSINIEIGQRLRKKRTQLGKTLQETAAEAGVAYSTMRNYEGGQRQPSIGQLKKLATVLQTSAAYLSGLASFEGNSNSLAFVTANAQLTGGIPTNNPIAFNAEILERHGLAPGNTALIQASDNFLNPDVKEGDYLLIDITTKDVTRTDIYAVSINGETVIRYCRRNIEEHGYIIYTTALNIPSMKVPADNQDVEILGRVVNINRWL